MRKSTERTIEIGLLFAAFCLVAISIMVASSHDIDYKQKEFEQYCKDIKENIHPDYKRLEEHCHGN